MKHKGLLISITLTTLGLVCVESGALDTLQTALRDAIHSRVPSRSTTIDDYLQFAPIVLWLVFSACRVPARHRFGWQFLLFAVAISCSVTTTETMKDHWDVLRPDYSAWNSFPSGHTATAFLGATLLCREYAGTSSKIAILGYVLALSTGMLRIYNNWHWLTDVIAGAGIGMFWVEIVWLIEGRLRNNTLPYRQSGPQSGATD